MIPLSQAVDDYLATRRALGYKLTEHGRMLPQFAAFLAQRGESLITIERALEFTMQPAGASVVWWHQRLAIVRGFAYYLRTPSATSTATSARNGFGGRRETTGRKASTGASPPTVRDDDVAPRFRNAWMSSGLHVASDLGAPLVHKRQRRGSLLLLDQTTTLNGRWRECCLRSKRSVSTARNWPHKAAGFSPKEE